ncbi:MAG: PolC-type DNA polymerase III [Erysipelotrichales bacterium]|nr:PolC-type DNA polymerase III [Erysipelotrichales bacterium]
MDRSVFERFLKKINIKNVEDFDMSFDVCEWDPLRRREKVLLMEIRKDIPWTYPLLMTFLSAINTIKDYRYEIHYHYNISPNEEDVYRLLTEWYYDKTNVAFLEDYHFENNKIIIDAEDENKIKSELEGFINLLKTIDYDFEIVVQKKEKQYVSEELDSFEVDDDYDEYDNFDEEEFFQQRKNKQYEDAEQAIEEYVPFEEKKNDFNNGAFKLIKIGAIDTNSENVDFNGKVFSCSETTTKKGKLIVVYGIADERGDAIHVKAFEGGKYFTSDKFHSIKIGMNVRVRGSASYDQYSKELAVMARFIDVLPPDELRLDNEENKRVELHLHTKMSTMDGVTNIEDYVRLAAQMGHKAIAVTDHGVVQAFPAAQKAGKDNNVKILYGTELYVIDDEVNAIRNPCNRELSTAEYVVFDFETTGLSTKYDDIIEFGAVKFSQGMIRERIDLFVEINRPIPKKIKKITGITDDMLVGQNSLVEAVHKMRKFIGDAILVSHNADFDFGFLNEACRKVNEDIFSNPVIDTLALARYIFPESKGHRLGALCNNMDVIYDEDAAHRADYDAEVLNEVWQAMIAVLTKDNPHLTHADLGELKLKEEHYKHLRPFHVVALAQDNEGIKNLFKLVSESHIKYFANVPKVPRSLLIKLREHLLLGSACFNGEVFDAAKTRTKEVLKKVVSFYDYIEVQPDSNYSYLINMEEVESIDVIHQFIKDIIEAADEEQKLVVATGDVHYLNPSDKIYRDVFISAKAIGNANHPLMPYSREKMEYFVNPDQHYRTTREMLDAFNYLGEERAYEIVVKNTNLIADSLESVKPLKDKLYTPTIENCENLLRELCYNTAHEMYGDNLPPIVAERLEKELDGIINNGYSVIYYIAHKIIKKSNEDGYMVGSRGSVGSSFVATMAKITEVNPLPPHYVCPHCKHSEFEDIPKVSSGFDLPEKDCPICGTRMKHDGQNIPFATFLGFNADKVPDIDLNFPGDYQGRAFLYTKELLGPDNVFKAGTIETVAEKNAYGYARGYFERIGPKIGRDLDKVNKAQIEYLAAGCTGVKRTTGQHPGGIVVIPTGYEVYDFTPIQYPADNKESEWRTTHFDFHAIHDNILKLDLLGHVDPMALKMMSDNTGIDVKTIPLNDPETLSIFSSRNALNCHSNYLNESTGALGIPEFGTNLGREMLKETSPKLFSDLLILSGLSHGTGVWAGNAQELIRNGTCTLREVIGCRDDIMTYLAAHGVEPLTAFKIMEDVRKGKKVKPEYEQIMHDNNIPQYYIDSCNKIMYMFPKAHATAYVMMAIRVGWFKVHRPLDYYAVYLSVRCEQFELETMLSGEKEIIRRLEELKAKGYDASAKETEIIKTLTICLEMAERGYKFEKIDLYKSDATKFVVDYENNLLIPPFIAIDGLGEAAGESVIEARKDGKFLSKEDLLARSRLSQTHVAKLQELGSLDGLAETNQMDLFSFFNI